MRIEITPTHFAQGVRCSPNACAVHQAIVEQYGEVEGLHVGGMAIYLADRVIASFPPVLDAAIARWDCYGTIPSQTFAVDVDLPLITFNPHPQRKEPREQERGIPVDWNLTTARQRKTL